MGFLVFILLHSIGRRIDDMPYFPYSETSNLPCVPSPGILC